MAGSTDEIFDHVQWQKLFDELKSEYKGIADRFRALRDKQEKLFHCMLDDVIEMTENFGKKVHDIPNIVDEQKSKIVREHIDKSKPTEL